MNTAAMQQSQPSRNVKKPKKSANGLRQPCPAGTVGNLEKLPLELRQMIYEYALKAGTPLEAPGRDLGFIPNYRDPENNRKRRYEKSRLTLLYVCKAMKKEASWVLHNKVPLKLEMTAMLARYGDIGVAWNVQTNLSKIYMWINAAQYRNIELAIPLTDEATPLADSIELLLDTVTQLLECWDRLNGTTDAVQNCKVSVQLGRLFAMKTHPSRITAPPTERIRKALKKLARCISNNKDFTQWTVTAMDDIKPKKNRAGAC